MVTAQGIREWLTVPSPEKKMALAAEKGENPRFSSSCDRMAKLIEGNYLASQGMHGDALEREKGSPRRSITRRRRRVHALEQQGASRWTKSYKVIQGFT